MTPVRGYSWEKLAHKFPNSVILTWKYRNNQVFGKKQGHKMKR